MIDIAAYQELKSAAEAKRREADRAAGQAEQIAKRLKSEFGCDTIKEAEKLLAKMVREQEKLEGEFKEELEAFQKEYGELLK